MDIMIEYEGMVFCEASPEAFIAKGLPAEFVAEEIDRQMRTRKIRGQINLRAGDTDSLLGTTSDAASLAIFGLATLVSKLSTANSLADVREAAQPFAELSADFLAKVDSNEVVLPFMLKGVETVVADIETRSTAVSDALKVASEE